MTLLMLYVTLHLLPGRRFCWCGCTLTGCWLYTSVVLLSLGVSVAPLAGGPAAGGRLVLRAELGALADANGAGLSLEWEEGFGADGSLGATKLFAVSFST